MKTLSKQLGALIFLLPYWVAYSTSAPGANNIPHASITFEPGSFVLTETDRSTLRDLVQNVRDLSPIDTVKIAAWSDKALPGKGQRLSDLDGTLASNRLDAVSSYLKTSLAVSNVDSYNMAETSNWLSRTFGTSDAELKSMFGKKGAEPPVTNSEFDTIKKVGGPSKVVVVIRRK